MSRAELARLGREWMLYGHTYDRALMSQVAMRLGGGRATEPTSIWEWKGASPNYTRRMKRLMRIEGDGVDAIVEALLAGSLRRADGRREAGRCRGGDDVPPHRGPDFDATAVATNPACACGRSTGRRAPPRTARPTATGRSRSSRARTR
jgi:hypothetical protein